MLIQSILCFAYHTDQILVFGFENDPRRQFVVVVVRCQQSISVFVFLNGPPQASHCPTMHA